MVYSHTSLSTVEKLSEDNPLGCALKISSLIDDDWTFSSKLQDARGKVLGGFNRYESACLSGSSEADDIKS